MPVYGKDFTYTGEYLLIDDNDGNWRLKFLTSGTFIPLTDIMIDVFLVGGGGGGTNNNVANIYPKIDLGSSGIVIIRNHRE